MYTLYCHAIYTYLICYPYYNPTIGSLFTRLASNGSSGITTFYWGN
jgi:hypothetical protein